MSLCSPARSSAMRRPCCCSWPANWLRAEQIVRSYREHGHEWPGRSRPVGASGAAVRLAAVSGFLLDGGTGYERGTLGVRGDVLLGVALQASVMAEYLAGGAGDAEGGVGMSELVGASRVSDYAVDGDFGLCRTRRST